MGAPAEASEAIEAFRRRLAELERQVAILNTAPRLKSSAIYGGALEVLNTADRATVLRAGALPDGGVALAVYDEDGVETVRLGEQPGATPFGLTILGATVDAVAATQNEAQFLNASVTTVEQTLLSAPLTVPEWANTALVFANASFQITNGSGGFQTMVLGIDIDGVPGTGGMSKSTSNGFTEPITNHRGRVITAPGATISVGARCYVLSGTNSANIGRLTAIAVFLRA